MPLINQQRAPQFRNSGGAGMEPVQKKFTKEECNA
jgi:hypothetical protein